MDCRGLNRVVRGQRQMCIRESSNTVPIGDRSGEVVEPLLKNQWFLDVKEMANKSLNVVQDGTVKFKPKYWENTFFEWMNKIQPWCISRPVSYTTLTLPKIYYL